MEESTSKLMERISYAYMQKETIIRIKNQIAKLKEARIGIKDAMQKYNDGLNANTIYCFTQALTKMTKTEAFRWLQSGIVIVRE